MTGHETCAESVHKAVYTSPCELAAAAPASVFGYRPFGHDIVLGVYVLELNFYHSST